MKRFIALLRGINVSGQKKIKMSELKVLFEDAGFQQIETYIQSGNVIFSSKEYSEDQLAKKISLAIKNKFLFEVNIIIITSIELDKVLLNNPFIKKKKDDDKLYVTFLSGKPSMEQIKKLEEVNFSPEEYLINGKVIYLFLPNGAGKAKLNNNYFENKLKVVSTTRNWRTVSTLSGIIKSH